MRTSRRRFLKLAAAGSAALLAGAKPALAQPKATRTRGPARTAAIQKEIDSQKKYVAKQLQVIRAYPLQPGSEMAFAFRPLGPRKRGAR